MFHRVGFGIIGIEILSKISLQSCKNTTNIKRKNENDQRTKRTLHATQDNLLERKPVLRHVE